MLGSIIGDLAGSIYEFNQTKSVKKIIIKKLIKPDSFFSDDTILVVALADAICSKVDYETKLKEYGKNWVQKIPKHTPYFKEMFSPGFSKWIKGDFQGTSTGNGAMMRISPVGFLFDNEEEIIKNCKLATTPSHNSNEAVNGATKVALTIFYARKVLSKEQILKKLALSFSFKPFEKFNYTCSDTLDNCFYALFTSNSFEEAVKKVISFGGDTDTNACIVGGMAEALFGIPENLRVSAMKKIPQQFVEILQKAYACVKNLK